MVSPRTHSRTPPPHARALSLPSGSAGATVRPYAWYGGGVGARLVPRPPRRSDGHELTRSQVCRLRSEEQEGGRGARHGSQNTFFSQPSIISRIANEVQKGAQSANTRERGVYGVQPYTQPETLARNIFIAKDPSAEFMRLEKDNKKMLDCRC